MASVVPTFLTAVVLVLCCMAIRPSSSQCGTDGREFLREPGTIANSPLTCNILTATVTLTCEIEGDGGATIGWFYSTTEEMAVGAQGDLIEQNSNNGYSISSSSDLDSITSTLTISPYEMTHNGFYYCQVVQAANTLLTKQPSRVVVINTCRTLDQLARCPSSMSLEFSSTTTGNCALDTSSTTRVPNVAEGTGIVFPEICIPDITTTTTATEMTMTTTNETTTTNVLTTTTADLFSSPGGQTTRITSTVGPSSPLGVVLALSVVSVVSIVMLVTLGILLVVVLYRTHKKGMTKAADGGQVVPSSQALENTKQIETEVNLAYGTTSSGENTEGRQCAAADGEASYEYIT